MNQYAKAQERSTIYANQADAAVELQKVLANDVEGGQASNIIEEDDLEKRVVDDNGTVRYIASHNDIYDEFGIHAHWALFDADGSPMIWGDSETGIVNLTQVNFNGSTLLESLVQLLQEGWIVSQQATVGSETRIGRIGLISNGTYPELRIEFNEPSATTVSVPNGDFETLDMSDWTEDVGAWDASSGYGYGLSNTSSKPKITSENKIAITAGNIYTFSAGCSALVKSQYGLAFTLTCTVKIDVKFYDSGDSLVATENVGTRTVSQYFPTPGGLSLASLSLGWGEATRNIEVPATATQFEFVAYIDTGGSDYNALSVDDFTVTQVAAESALTLEDDGVYYTPAGGTKQSLGGGGGAQLLYSKSEWSRITTTDETEVFSVILPADFFTTKKLFFKVRAKRTQSTTSSRTLTTRLRMEGTNIASRGVASVSTTTRYYWIEGDITKTGTDAQWGEYNINQHTIGGSFTGEGGDGGGATEDESATIEVEFSLQLSSATNFSADYFGVEVWAIPNI